MEPDKQNILQLRGIFQIILELIIENLIQTKNYQN